MVLILGGSDGVPSWATAVFLPLEVLGGAREDDGVVVLHREGAAEVPAVEGKVAQAPTAFGRVPAEAEAEVKEGEHPREDHLRPHPGRVPASPRPLAAGAWGCTAGGLVGVREVHRESDIPEPVGVVGRRQNSGPVPGTQVLRVLVVRRCR